MLTITDGVMTAFKDDARRKLRASLLTHWYEDMRTSGDLVGPEGREQVIREVEALAAEDPSLDLADLMMIADLRLVALANEVRNARATKAN
jgi:hypothetical protein